MMTEQDQHELDFETLKRAMKAFKKRPKLTALDDIVDINNFLRSHKPARKNNTL
jgi:hypothetical protein